MNSSIASSNVLNWSRELNHDTTDSDSLFIDEAVFTDWVSFDDGETLNVFTKLSSQINLDGFSGESFEAYSDFLHTARLTYFEAVDATGAPIDITATGASGTNYRVNGAVPEPASMGLVAIGLVALARRRSASRAGRRSTSG